MKPGKKNILVDGYSMIEVMVTIAILSFGLLGLAAMFMKISNYNSSSIFRSVAAQQAYDMADRMRANAGGLSNGNYDSISFSGTQNCSACSSGQSCSTTALATYDACTWNNQNAAQLPYGRGTVSSTVTNGVKAYAISVYWDDDRTGSTDLNVLKKFVLTVDP